MKRCLARRLPVAPACHVSCHRAISPHESVCESRKRKYYTQTKVCARPSPQHTPHRSCSAFRTASCPTAALACRPCSTCTIFIIAPPLHAHSHCSLSPSVRQVVSMQGRRYAMLVFLAITLSTVHGWVIPSDDKASSLSSHESAITGGIDGARRQLKASGCSGSWSVCPPAPRPLLHIIV